MDTPSFIRSVVIEQSYRASVGHIGSALCIAEILAVLYDDILRIEDPQSLNRDRFVLSKGHAALALYAVLRRRGWIGEEELNTYCANGSTLSVHPDHRLPGVDFSTGSLGHGPGYAVGCALAARIADADRRSFVLLSDAELNEGSVWEALMFAAHHRLGTFTAIVDDNGQQALGRTVDVLDPRSLRQKFEAFGFDVREVDGHDVDQLLSALSDLPADGQAPRIVVAHTVFGKGVSFMEGLLKWHYWPMSESEYRQAASEIAAAARPAQTAKSCAEGVKREDGGR